MKSLTRKRFFLLLVHHSLNRDRQRVHSKGCAGSLTALLPLVPSCDELWENPHRGWLSSSELASRPKSSLLTNGAEASAVEPWTAPLLSHCRLPEGAQCWGGFSQERLCPWEGLGFTRAAVSQHACHSHSSTDLREASHSCLLEYSEGPGLKNPRSLLIDLLNLQALSFSLMNSKDFFPPRRTETPPTSSCI